jgi:hypothetical protein
MEPRRCACFGRNVLALELLADAPQRVLRNGGSDRDCAHEQVACEADGRVGGDA